MKDVRMADSQFILQTCILCKQGHYPGMKGEKENNLPQPGLQEIKDIIFTCFHVHHLMADSSGLQMLPECHLFHYLRAFMIPDIRSNSCNPHSNSMTYSLLLVPFYRCENLETDSVSCVAGSCGK